MIPRFHPVLGLAELAAALHPPGADDVTAFETAFAAAVGQHHAVAFPYGRTGLLVLLRALGLADCPVICPAYTCVVVPHAIVHSGNKPRFIDAAVDANMNLDLAESAISSDTGALIATSIFGHPVDLDRLEIIRRDHPELVIIQDCAHSFTAEWRSRRVNQAGTAAIFGLNISKTMTSIFGGMVTTDDEALAGRLRLLRSQLVKPAALSKSVARTLYLLAIYAAFNPLLFGLTEKLRQWGLLDRFTRYYEDNVIDLPRDFDVAMTDVEARVGLVQTLRLDSLIAARRLYADCYHRLLANVPGLAWIKGDNGASYSHIVARVANRGAVLQCAAQRRVQLGELIEYAIPEMPAYRDLSASQEGFPMAGAFARQTINLPVSGSFDVDVAMRTVKVMESILADQPPPAALPSQASR